MVANQRNVTAYGDDILVKSKTPQQHPENLEETFDTLKQYGMRLNPSKCSFCIREGKFLGFYVGKGGIRHNPEKVQVILSMSPPKTIREVQWQD